MSFRLVVAMVLGGIIGLERDYRAKDAGFRTHFLVAVGSALFTLLSMYGFSDGVRDTSRVAAQVVSGIGFLGAGTILHEGLTVRGLTTAASLWMVSAIGLATGAGMYFISIVATVVTMVTLITFHNWEKRFNAGRMPDRKFIRITAVNNPGLITSVTNYLTESGVKVKTINVKNNASKKQIVLELYLKFGPEQDAGSITMGIQQIDGILTIENVG